LCFAKERAFRAGALIRGEGRQISRGVKQHRGLAPQVPCAARPVPLWYVSVN
jgi:hypothetical protein